MRKRLSGAVVFVLALSVGGLGWLLAQDQPPEQSEAEQPDASSEAQQDAAEPQQEPQEEGAEPQRRRRLPNYYGQIGLSDAQREEIYAIQAEYNVQIDALLQQVEELRSERDDAIRGVLSDEQRALLDQLIERARRRREERRRAADGETAQP